MAARGMGAIYSQTSTGELLRRPPDTATREALLDQWYWPHHSKVESLVNDVVARFGVCLIVDCHSFPSVALPYERDQTSDRADLCIGTHPFHTPLAIRDAIVATGKEEGYSVAIDAPFSGALVPLSSYRKERRILSVMIEVNRRLYMEEDSGMKMRGFRKVRATLGKLVMAAEAAVK